MTVTQSRYREDWPDLIVCLPVHPSENAVWRVCVSCVRECVCVCGGGIEIGLGSLRRSIDNTAVRNPRHGRDLTLSQTDTQAFVPPALSTPGIHPDCSICVNTALSIASALMTSPTQSMIHASALL